MGWRTVLVSGRAKLDLKLNHLVVRKEDVYKIHIDEITIVIVDSIAVSITTALIDRLVEKKIKLIFCGKDHNPIGEIVNYYNRHNSVKMIQKQVNWSSKSKGKVWRKIIEEKINKQSKLLKDINYFSYELLQDYLEEIKDFDSTNREGHAAKVYFFSLFGYDFSRRNDNSINSMLNYGYSIILSLFTREIASLGYLTQIGIFHENQFNFYNLASDFMEPLRPLIDSIVLNYMPEKFGREEKEEISESLISDITDKVIPKIEEWKNRPLEPVYPVIYIDAVHFSVKDSGIVKKKAAYIVLGINKDGLKEVLGMYIGDVESSKYWLTVFN